MGFKAVNCPSCGANVELDSNREFGFCSYCGTKIVQDKIIHEHRGSVTVEGTANVASLTERARMMLSDGDFRSADTYFDRVLDIDPHNAYAYWGKMCCSIGVRDDEQLEKYPHSVKSIPSFHKAIDFSTGEEHERYVALGNATEENQYLIAKERCDNVAKKAKKSLRIKGIVHGIISFFIIFIPLIVASFPAVIISTLISGIIFVCFSMREIKILNAHKSNDIFDIPPELPRASKVVLALCHYTLLIVLFGFVVVTVIPEETSTEDIVETTETVQSAYTDESLTEAAPRVKTVTYIKSYVTTHSYSDEDYLIVEYKYTNTSNTTKSFFTACRTKVFQNGVECQPCIITADNFKNNQEYADVKPGATLTLHMGYTLFNNSDDVELEVTDLLGFETYEKRTISLK